MIIPTRALVLMGSCIIILLIKQQLKCVTGILKNCLYMKLKKKGKIFALERLLSIMFSFNVSQ